MTGAPTDTAPTNETLRDRAERVLAETPRTSSQVDGIVRDLCAAIIDGYDAGFADATARLGREGT